MTSRRGSTSPTRTPSSCRHCGRYNANVHVHPGRLPEALRRQRGRVQAVAGGEQRATDPRRVNHVLAVIQAADDDSYRTWLCGTSENSICSSTISPTAAPSCTAAALRASLGRCASRGTSGGAGRRHAAAGTWLASEQLSGPRADSPPPRRTDRSPGLGGARTNAAIPCNRCQHDSHAPASQVAVRFPIQLTHPGRQPCGTNRPDDGW